MQLATHFGGTCADKIEQGMADLLPKFALSTDLPPKFALSTDCLGHAAGQLSVDQHQRVGIARALINHPEK